MGRLNPRQGDRNRFGRCEICLELIPIEYYFSTGDTIVCYECSTEYTLTSKNPVKLSLIEKSYDPVDYSGDELNFD